MNHLQYVCEVYKITLLFSKTFLKLAILPDELTEFAIRLALLAAS